MTNLAKLFKNIHTLDLLKKVILSQYVFIAILNVKIYLVWRGTYDVAFSVTIFLVNVVQTYFIDKLQFI